MQKGLGMILLTLLKFDEESHPRDENGKFTSGDGSEPKASQEIMERHISSIIDENKKDYGRKQSGVKYKHEIGSKVKSTFSGKSIKRGDSGTVVGYQKSLDKEPSYLIAFHNMSPGYEKYIVNNVFAVREEDLKI